MVPMLQRSFVNLSILFTNINADCWSCAAPRPCPSYYLCSIPYCTRNRSSGEQFKISTSFADEYEWKVFSSCCFLTSCNHLYLLVLSNWRIFLGTLHFLKAAWGMAFKCRLLSYSPLLPVLNGRTQKFQQRLREMQRENVIVFLLLKQEWGFLESISLFVLTGLRGTNLCLRLFANLIILAGQLQSSHS